MNLVKPALWNEPIQALGVPMGIVWRLQDVYRVTLVRQLYSIRRPRLSFHGFQISEIQILQDMLQKHALQMMSLTNEERVALLKMKLTKESLVGAIGLCPEIRKRHESSYEVKTIRELMEHGEASLHAAGFTSAEIDLIEQRLVSHGFV